MADRPNRQSKIATIIGCLLASIPGQSGAGSVLAVMSVWTAEALNTAFEFLTDVASPNFHPIAEKAKDVAAGAVLVSATGAAIIGILVFWPRIVSLI